MKYRVALHTHYVLGSWFNIVSDDVNELIEEDYHTFVRWTGPWIEIEV